jgi:5-methylcytosine-specific restriction endonuclease McrA
MHRLVPFILLVLSPFLTGALDLGSNSDVQPVATLSTSLTESMGPAAHLWALPSDAVAGKRPGSRFTQKDKDAVKQDNASRNEGKNRCENCGVETVPGEQHKKGVTPPKNETQVDHVIPRAKGGPGDPDNGQVLCRECNIEKSDKAP